MKKLFTDHPDAVGETYFQHLYFASCFAAQMLIGGLACLIHAVLPFLFKDTGSNFLLRMTTNFVKRMPRADDRVLSLGALIDQKKNANGNQ